MTHVTSALQDIINLTIKILTVINDALNATPILIP